jgi:tRNA-splicing ligase RtcB
MEKQNLIQIGECLWEIPANAQKGMLVPARVFARADMLDAMLSDRSLEQLTHVATLPGIQVAAIAMPDAHEGYGFPIGGVAATRYPDGMISPGGIGYDINCGVRLLLSDLTWNDDLEARLPALAAELKAQIPSGAGKGGFLNLDDAAIDAVLREGAAWAVNQGYGTPRDLDYIEYHGKLTSADPAAVSPQARRRGHNQVGTLGSGNHFLEVDRVTDIFDEEAAQAFGLKKDQLVVLIHTGSRGLGHQVATDYIKLMQEAMPKYGYKPPDRELACVPYNSPEGQQYGGAMAAAANFAWCNRQVLTHLVRQAWQTVMGTNAELTLLYDVAHNMARLEEYMVNGEMMQLIVHRKGATRAYGPGHPELPEAYKEAGQPVLIPGSMGTASYVLAGNLKSAEISFGSSCHGAGRRLSRTAVKKQVDAPTIKNDLLKEGIHIEALSFKEIAEEAPIAYKDIESVVDTVQQAGIARKVARLRPLVVIKG